MDISITNKYIHRQIRSNKYVSAFVYVYIYICTNCVRVCVCVVISHWLSLLCMVIWFICLLLVLFFASISTSITILPFVYHYYSYYFNNCCCLMGIWWWYMWYMWYNRMYLTVHYEDEELTLQQSLRTGSHGPAILPWPFSEVVTFHSYIGLPQGTTKNVL